MNQAQNQSEVAQLRKQLEQEYEAMLRGIHGLAAGTARHDFMRERMDNVSNYQARLAKVVGDVDAALIVGNAYYKVANEQLEG
jgi:hypothetical protein